MTLLLSLPDLTRLPPRESKLDGRWTTKPYIDANLSICVFRYLRYMLILFLNILTLL